MRIITNAADMPLEIEKGIPIPKHPMHRRKYPFLRMEVGDSFTVPLNGQEPNAVQQSVHGSARNAGVKVRTRTVGQEVRVWLVSREEVA